MQTLKRLWAKIRRLKLPGSGGQGGFTLIELLVVVIILGILAGVVTVNVARFAGRGQDSANEAERDNVQLAIDSLMTDNKALTVNTDANARQTFGGGSFNFRTADWPAEPADVPLYPTMDPPRNNLYGLLLERPGRSYQTSRSGRYGSELYNTLIQAHRGRLSGTFLGEPPGVMNR